MINKERTNIKILIILFFLVIIIGITGYMLIEKHSFIDALFMTIITISTVGYSTIHKLSDTGIIFTIFLILTSFVIIGFIVQKTTRFIYDGEMKLQIKNRKRKRIMKNFNNHVIVCGYGLNGSHAAAELLQHNEQIVVIDIDENVIENNEYEDNDNIIFVKGDAKKEDVLYYAKIDKAKALISALSDDAGNLFVVLTARDINTNLRIISRASEDTSDHKLRIAGANSVILPDSVGGVRMAKLVTEPDVIEFLENLLAKSGKTVNIVEINCSEINPNLLGKSIYELEVRKKSGANIIGMKRLDGEYYFNPGAEFIIEKGDKLFVLGTPTQVEDFKKITK